MTSATIGWAWTAVLLAVAAVAGGSDAPAESPALVVRWSDPQRTLPSALLRDLERQAETLFRRWGVRLRTSEAGDAGDLRTIRVILLDCNRLGQSPARTMGQTSTVPSESPAVWILVPNVRMVLDAAERNAPGNALTRALALVAAHEILHVLAPGLAHASSGVMRSHLRASDLVEPGIRIDGAFRQALHAALRPHPQPIDS
jgi:hypothetical protein